MKTSKENSEVTLLNNKNTKKLSVGCLVFIIIFLLLVMIAIITDDNTQQISTAPNISSTPANYEGACDYLKDLNFNTNGYKDHFGVGEYYCTAYLNLDNLTDIAYTAMGEKDYINKTYIKLSLHKNTDKNNSLNSFINISEKLLLKSTGANMTPDIKNAILSNKNSTWEVNDNTIKFELEKWETGLGADYIFTISKK